MKARIIAIGDELLAGTTINSNSQWLSQQLGDIGFDVVQHQTLPDDIEVIKELLADVGMKKELVLFTGGLGPTEDDLTKKAFSAALNVSLECDLEYLDYLKSRYGIRSDLKEQAQVFSGGGLFKNKIGTAPGLLLQKDLATLVLLPGVPSEMKNIFKTSLKDYLKRKYSVFLEVKSSRTILLIRLQEVDVKDFLSDLDKQYGSISIGIYPHPGLLSVVLRGYSIPDLEAAEKVLCYQYADCVLDDSSDIVTNLAVQMNLLGSTLAVAESCTGGGVASMIVKTSGVSSFFLGGVVSYSNDIKETILGVSPEVLESEGAVSESVVLEMARNVRKKFRSDYGLALSGVAGPEGGSMEKPVGTVWMAISAPWGEEACCLHSHGDRSYIIEHAINEILGLLWQRMKFMN